MNASLVKGDAVEERMSQDNIATTEVADKISLDSVVMKKMGMTRIFDTEGNHLPVTVLSIEDSKVVQVKTLENDGYSSVKFAYDQKRPILVRNPKVGELKKAGISETFSKMSETKIDPVDGENIQAGMSVVLPVLEKGTLINVTGVTKGKGFAGVVKRYGFAGGPMSHGSKFHRTTGSIGNRATPGRVFKGKKNARTHGNR
jgi:large subunit ribosomal protein L3